MTEMTEIKVASRKSRIFALMIDHFILMLIAVFPLTFFMMNEELQSGRMFAIVGIWIFIVFILYSSKDSFKGQSVGRWIIGIAVRDENNKDDVPSIPRLFLRNVMLVIWPIEFIILATNANKQRLGDRIANTVVVKVREMSVWKKIMVVLLAIIILFGLLFTTILFSLKNSEAYETAITYIENNEEIIGETGGIEGYSFFPSGSVQISNGYGESIYSINVKGKDKDIYVEVYLTKKPRQEWIVEEVYYE